MTRDQELIRDFQTCYRMVNKRPPGLIRYEDGFFRMSNGVGYRRKEFIRAIERLSSRISIADKLEANRN